MLVLTREVNQSVTIITSSGERVEVTMIRNTAGRVRLGFKAAKNVVIHRNEILQEIESQERRAA